MNNIAVERLHECIGNIDDSILHETETSDFAIARSAKRKRIAKYSAVGAAGAVISIGLAVAFWKIKTNRAAKIA